MSIHPPEAEPVTHGRQIVKSKPLPTSFNPEIAEHVFKVLSGVIDAYGPGFEMVSFDRGSRVATFCRSSQVAVVSGEEGNIKQINIPGDVRESDGERYAATLSDTYPGFELTSFQPHLGRAIIQRMEDRPRRVREAVAEALSVKPWRVQITSRPDGGFSLGLPSRFSMSRDQVKLEEIATTVAGRPGWWVHTDPVNLTADMLPGEPPTFPAAAPTPLRASTPVFDLKAKGSLKIPVGIAMSAPGEKTWDTFYLDMKAGAHCQVGGISGGGKSVTINAIIHAWLARGAELVVIDTPAKAVDFKWCKPFVRPGGWGCEGDAESATAIELVRREGVERAKVLGKLGVENWMQAWDKGAHFTPLVVVIDELTALFTMEAVPKAGRDAPPKMLQMKEEAEQTNFYKTILSRGIKRSLAELRSVGVFIIVSTQVASATTGIDPAMRTNLHHKVLMGSRPTEQQKKLIFADISRLPEIPDSILSDPDAVRGVGVADPEGGVPTIIKSYFRTTEEYAAHLASIGRTPTVGSLEPTRAQIADVTGMDEMLSDVDLERQATAARRESMGDPVAPIPGMEALDHDGQPLTGAAKAAFQSKVLAASLKAASLKAAQ